MTKEQTPPCEYGHEPVKLTRRQTQVAQWLISAFDVKHIAARMGINVSTVQKHVGAMHAKAGTYNLHGLALWADERSGCCISINYIERYQFFGRGRHEQRQGLMAELVARERNWTPEQRAAVPR